MPAFEMLPILLLLLTTEKEKEFVTELYNKYERLVGTIAFERTHNWNETSDIVQEVFVRIIENISIFEDLNCDNTKYSVLAITRAAVKRYYRKQNHEVFIEGEEMFLVDTSQFARVEDYITNEAERDNILAFVSSLNEDYQAVFLMKHIGFKHTEIACLLEISIDVSKKRFERARKKLKQLSKDKYDE